MKLVLAFVTVIWLLLTSLLGVAQEPQTPDFDLSQRYLLLDTFRVSTMQEELSAAGEAGYRVVAGVGRSLLLLEKSTEPPLTYQYTLPWPADQPLNEAAAQGFRVVRSTLGMRRDTGDAAMEKLPQSEQLFEYKLLGTTRIATMQQELAQAVAEGYEVLGMTIMAPLGLDSSARERVVLLERPANRSAEQPPPVSDPNPGAPDRYLLLHTDRTGTLQKELTEAASQGYRVLDTSDYELAALLEKSDEPVEILLLATTRTSTLEKEINRAAVKGYRLLPQTLGAVEKRLFGFLGGKYQTEIFAVMEKRPDSTERHEYLILATRRTSTMQKELEEAAQRGYSVVAMTLTAEGRSAGLLPAGEKIVILEKPAAR